MAVSDYSMFDVRAAKEPQRHKTAYEAAQIPLGRVPIYASSVGGDLYNEGLMGLAGMLGGTPDPATAKQQAILEIQERFPDPDTFEEFMDLYNALRMGGFYEFAEQALKAANDIRASMPTPTKPGAEIEKYNEAVKGGYEGSFFQYQMDLKKAGADKTTMMPTPAKGFQYQQDENGNWIATIIPGGSADLEIQAADAKALLAKVNAQKAGNVVLKNVGLVRNAIKNPQTFFGMEVGSTGWGSLLKDIPATQAKGVAGMIATIKGNVGFDKLQAMREASPTGGALGQVSELELKLLMSTIGSLDQAQSDADLLRVLNEIEYWYNHIVHGAAYASTAVEETEEVVDDPLGVL
jgi:hypothetical protein